MYNYIYTYSPTHAQDYAFSFPCVPFSFSLLLFRVYKHNKVLLVLHVAAR